MGNVSPAIGRRGALTCCERVVPTNAARYFKTPAPILKHRRVTALLAAHANGRVIELGAGCLRNALYLQRREFRTTVLEIRGIENRFPEAYAAFRRMSGKIVYAFPHRRRFEIALATFVIETICDPSLRHSILAAVAGVLVDEGALILSARGPADLVTARAKGVRCSDGYLTPNCSFARSYTKRQLVHLLVTAGFSEFDFLHKKGTRAPELLHVIARTRRQGSAQ